MKKWGIIDEGSSLPGTLHGSEKEPPICCGAAVPETDRFSEAWKVKKPEDWDIFAGTGEPYPVDTNTPTRTCAKCKARWCLCSMPASMIDEWRGAKFYATGTLEAKEAMECLDNERLSKELNQMFSDLGDLDLRDHNMGRCPNCRQEIPIKPLHIHSCPNLIPER